MVLRAWTWGFFLLICVGGLGTTALMAIWSQAGITSDAVQVGSWGLYGVLLLWRVWRLGAVLTPERVTVRGFFVDHHYPWDQVAGFAVVQSANTVGETSVPVVRTADDGELFNWLSGYSFRGSNRRVQRQVDRMNSYRAALDIPATR